MPNVRARLLSMLLSGHRRWVAAIAVMTGAIVVLAAAVNHSTTMLRADLAASRQVQDQTTHHATEWNFLITHLGSTEVAITLTVLGVSLLVALRHWRGALALALSVAVTQATVEVVKALVERPRPGDGLIDAAGFSFPSAHAATSVALYATLALIAARFCRGVPRALIVTAAVLLVLAVGGSRIYLGAHYPTDVVAGWLTGAILALGTWLVVSRIRLFEGRADATA